MNAGVTLEHDGESVVVRIPMQIKRRMGRMEIITPQGLEDSQPLKAAPQEPLVVALGRALYWQGLLDTSRYRSIAALAEALGIDRSYARRILTLATLAPDIVQTIVEGREPSGLSLEKLVKRLPLEWEAQRQALGVSAR